MHESGLGWGLLPNAAQNRSVQGNASTSDSVIFAVIQTIPSYLPITAHFPLLMYCFGHVFSRNFETSTKLFTGFPQIL